MTTYEYVVLTAPQLKLGEKDVIRVEWSLNKWGAQGYRLKLAFGKYLYLEAEEDDD